MTYVVEQLEGERLDRIARKLYGSERGGTVEALLEANPGLAGAVIVPEGTVIVVPAEVAVKPARRYVLSWE